MELGLSLGDSSLLKPFADVAQKSTSNVPDLSFHMGLCLPSKSTYYHQVLEDEDNQDVVIEKHSTQDTDKTTPLRLLSTLGARFPRHSENGSSEGGSRMVPAEEEVSSATAASSDLVKYNREYVENKRSLDDDSNENKVTRKKLRLSKEQSAFLEESFKEQRTMNPKQKLVLAKQLNLRPRQVEVWFQNRRARTKLKQTEVDCEYLKKYFETLSKENRKLQKEVLELRALKKSSEFDDIQSPATTLTMCPSCHQGVATSTPLSIAATAIAAKPTTAGSVTPSPPFPLSRSKFYSFSHAPQRPHNS